MIMSIFEFVDDVDGGCARVIAKNLEEARAALSAEAGIPFHLKCEIPLDDLEKPIVISNGFLPF